MVFKPSIEPTQETTRNVQHPSANVLKIFVVFFKVPTIFPCNNVEEIKPKFCVGILRHYNFYNIQMRFNKRKSSEDSEDATEIRQLDLMPMDERIDQWPSNYYYGGKLNYHLQLDLLGTSLILLLSMLKGSAMETY